MLPGRKDYVLFVSVSSEAGTWQGLQKDLWTPKLTSELCEFYLYSMASKMYDCQFLLKNLIYLLAGRPSLELSCPVSFVIFSFPPLETHTIPSPLQAGLSGDGPSWALLPAACPAALRKLRLLL